MTELETETRARQAHLLPAAEGAIAASEAIGATRRRVDARPWLAALVAPLALVLAVALATAPVTASIAVIVAGALVLAWHRPEWAFALAILLFGVEGSVKLLLDLEPTPVPAPPRAVGAAAIDVVLLAAVAGLVAADRLRTPRALWSRAGRPGRAVIVALLAWLALSVLQIGQGDDLERGLAGFRLLHGYTVVAVAALIAFAAPRDALASSRLLLWIGLVVGAYASVRVAIGPAFEERAFAMLGGVNHSYGDNLRAVGSFSAAVGMESFLMPLSAFALVAGYLERRLRPLAWPAALVGLVAIGGTYGRAPLMAIGLGLMLTLGVLLAARDLSRGRKLAAVALFVGVLAAMYGGLHAAGTASPELRERVAGVVDPFGDESVAQRFGVWEKAVSDVADHPLGQGVGAVGRASAQDDATAGGSAPDYVTTDNSFLEVAVEQGIPGAVLFLGGLVGAAVLLTARLSRLGGQRRAIGLAALTGFVSFLAFSTTGEYVEQPGKVVAWTMLGVAVAQALGPVDRGSRPGRLGRAPRPAWPPAAPWLGLFAAMVVIPLALIPSRDSGHAATKQIVPQAAEPLPAIREPGYYRELMRTVTIWMGTEGFGPWDYAATRFETGPRGSVVMTLEADSPARARRTLDELGRQLARASEREAAKAAGSRTLGPRPRVAAGPPATVPEPDRGADRIAELVPGELPGRPSPVWAAIAGALVTAGLWWMAAWGRER